MARIRTIKPTFFRHEALFDAEKQTGLPLRIAFAGLWTAADKEGRFEWKPRALKLDCLPYDDVDFSRVLDALTTRGFIRKYACGGIQYGWIESWQKHQIINNRETASTLPAFQESLEISITSTRDSRVDDETATPLGDYQGEGKGREGEGNKEVASASAPAPLITELPFHAEPEAAERAPKHESKSATTWGSYAEAYRRVYGTDPVRNRQVNAQLCSFIDRVGAVEAPAIAAFFLRHPNAFYRSRGHSVGCLLSDAEKLRTEWATQTVTTSVQARQQERTASNPFAKIAADMAAEESRNAV